MLEVASAYTRSATVMSPSVVALSTFNSSDEPRARRRLPPLSAFVGHGDMAIKRDVQCIMDFAIIAHPKTATSSTLKWLNEHPEVVLPPVEINALPMGQPAEHVRILYNLSSEVDMKRGYKAPRDLINPRSLYSIYNFWPKTKLIVGLRHPVLWFESFYNFRVRGGFDMPPAETLIGKCPRNSRGVCTDEGLFHIHLSNLGKTPRNTTRELMMLEGPRYKFMMEMPRLPNKVFLYEISQLHDKSNERRYQYRLDLTNYLDLQKPLEPMPPSASADKPKKKKAIEICDEKYVHVRAELMKHARSASLWIREYLLPHPDVTVSSPEYFHELIVAWMEDPCDNKEP